VSVAICEAPTSEDRYWILAAAMLDTVADDLGLCREAGWWTDRPEEMRGRCYEADQLLNELAGDGVRMLADVVVAETNRRVEIDTGWVVRRAKVKICQGQRGRTISALHVQKAIKLPHVSLVRRPGLNPWQADYKDLKAAHLCTRCGDALDVECDRHPAGHFYGCCKVCRQAHCENVKEDARRKRKPGPAGGIPWVQWSKQMCAKMKLSRQTLMRWMAAGKIPTPRIVKHSKRNWWVLPEGRAAA
jgi:hypothetical protein